eukprot:Nitzschia sp. Nitz4//scaffold19_size178191//15744//17228//NITZ4_001956-RA/size178191-augustus-gene-0.33-mRNA-1//1//CDS//3329540616//6401//frame0
MNSERSAQQKLKQTAALAKGFADDAGRAIGSFIPTSAIQQLTTRKYTLPDKSVASQVLMYRQLLHTKCRPGLKLSRDYQATVAQQAVMHMPWWEQGIEQSRKMVISYDNLISRLWLNGAIEPFQETNLLEPSDNQTLLSEEGLPPIPHPYWVDRLGFQQPDPVTDFRSGGVLSLAMMVYMVESHPDICQRFFSGDAAVLPFGITCINVTDMIAKFLMLAKSTDRMDALMSQKPFWRMFGDPNAILAVQELAMTLLADGVVELTKERQVKSLAQKHSTHTSMPSDMDEHKTEVTVFDFSTILERTERRVRDDLLGAGPKSVDELRAIAERLRVKYQSQVDRKVQRAQEQQQNQGEAIAPPVGSVSGNMNSPQIMDVFDKAGGAAGAVAGAAGAFAGGLFSKMTSFNKTSDTTTAAAPAPVSAPAPTIVDIPPPATETDWMGETGASPATDAFNNFSIGDDDDDDEIL